MWNDTPCVEWLGARTTEGYGWRRWQGSVWRAHRVAWTQTNGPIPDGLHVLHRCDNPPCINVDHLFLGTNADNVADRHAKGRDARTTGDANGARRHPETRARGDRNGMRLHPERAARGERIGNSVLRSEDIPVIRARIAAGESQSAVGLDYGVTQRAISMVVLRQTWRHVA